MDCNHSIKDKGNLVSFNSWSGGDYLHNTSTLYSAGNVEIQVTNDCAENGDTSFFIKLNGDGTSWNRVDLFRVSSGTFPSGTYTLELTVSNCSNPLSIVLFNHEANISRVLTSSFTGTFKYSLTGEISNESYVACRIITNESASAYFDDVSIFKV